MNKRQLKKLRKKNDEGKFILPWGIRNPHWKPLEELTDKEIRALNRNWY